MCWDRRRGLVDDGGAKDLPCALEDAVQPILGAMERGVQDRVAEAGVDYDQQAVENDLAGECVKDLHDVDTLLLTKDMLEDGTGSLLVFVK